MMQSALVESAKITAPRDCDRRVYVSDPEEIPLTFQVGLVGSDGVLLASDQLQTIPHETTDGRRVRLSQTARKIQVLNDRRIAYCASGARVSSDVVEYYASHFGNGDIEQQLIEARDAVMKDRPELSQWRERNTGDFLLAQACGNVVELWQMHVEPDSYNRPEPIFDREWIGDIANPASFFVELYAPLIASGQALFSVESLKLLAAHAVLAAGLNNPAGVRGLEMVVCKPDGFQRVSDEDIQMLKERSAELDKQIRQGLFGA